MGDPLGGAMGSKGDMRLETNVVTLKPLLPVLLFIAAAAAPLSAQAVVIPNHSFALNGALTDSLGSATLAQVGGSLGASGFTFARGEGLSLTGAFADPAVYSVEMVFRFDSLALPYGRVLNSSGTDNGLYIHDVGGARVDYYNSGSHPGGAFDLGQMHHLVFTRDNGGAIAYVDGAASLVAADYASSRVTGALGFFLDDLFETAPGYVDFIQTYDRVLTAGDVASLYNGGAPVSYVGPSGAPEPAAWAMMILGFCGAGAALRRRRSLTL